MAWHLGWDNDYGYTSWHNFYDEVSEVHDGFDVLIKPCSRFSGLTTATYVTCCTSPLATGTLLRLSVSTKPIGQMKGFGHGGRYKLGEPPQ